MAELVLDDHFQSFAHKRIRSYLEVYSERGATKEQVNEAFARVVSSEDEWAWGELLSDFFRRMELTDPSVARSVLTRFGGKRIVHGHTPIPLLTGQHPNEVTEPLVYADGLVVNADGGLYLGGRGFVFEPYA